MRVGADLMGRALSALERGSLTFTPQAAEGRDFHAKKIEKAETSHRFRFSPAEAVHNHIRGMSPFPGAWFEVEVQGRPVRVKALRLDAGVPGSGAPVRHPRRSTSTYIACSEGAVRLLLVQREGKGPTDGAAFLRGATGARVLPTPA